MPATIADRIRNTPPSHSEADAIVTSSSKLRAIPQHRFRKIIASIAGRGNPARTRRSAGQRIVRDAMRRLRTPACHHGCDHRQRYRVFLHRMPFHPGCGSAHKQPLCHAAARTRQQGPPTGRAANWRYNHVELRHAQVFAHRAGRLRWSPRSATARQRLVNPGAGSSPSSPHSPIQIDCTPPY